MRYSLGAQLVQVPMVRFTKSARGEPVEPRARCPWTSSGLTVDSNGVC